MISTTAISTTHPCNGVTVAFDTEFYFSANAELVVSIVDDDTGAIDQSLVLDVDYTVTGRQNADGGVVTLNATRPTGKSVQIDRVTPITMLTNLRNQTNYDPAVVEAALTKLTQIAQELAVPLSRALRLYTGDVDGSGRYNANGNRIVNLGSAQDATDAATLQDVGDLINAAVLTPGLQGSIVGDVVLSGSYRAFGSVIRQDTAASGWHFIDDSNHHPVGMSGSFTVNGDGSLTIPLSFSASKIGGVWTVVDEAYAAAGLSVGASVGLNNLILFFYGPWGVRLNNLAAAWGNYLPGSGSTIDTTQALVDGTVTFTHPAMVYSDASGPQVVIEKYAAGGNELFVVGSGLSKTGFKVQALDRIAAKVSVAAGVITVTSGLVTPPTVTWDAVNNRFDITTSASNSLYAPTLTSAAAGYLPVLEGSVSTTLFHVALYDYAGTKYTGASPPNYTFNFSRAGYAPALWSSANKLWIQRGIAKLHADDVCGATANIWLGGFHKV